MDAKLQKIKIIFTKIKDTRIQVMNVFSVLEVKLTKLKTMTNDFIKGNQDILFVFGLDSFKFQSKLIDFEYADMQKYFYALNNRMYCEYYKLFKIVSEYVDKTIGTNKTFEMIKSNSVFPIYKDLEPYKQYNFETIEEVHKTIILLLGGIQEHIVFKETELENYRIKQHSGLNINNFVNTFLFNVTMIKQNLGLFISYLDFFHNIHMKHFKRFSKKMKSMDDYLNEDITFDDSNPRRKTSRDFDDTLSQISSISSTSDSSKGGGVVAAGAGACLTDSISRPKAVPRKSETKSSFLKKGVDSVINTFRVFGSKPVQNSDTNRTNNNSSNNSVSSISVNSNNSNLNLHIEEKSQSILDNIAPLSEFNATNLTRERTDTINEQLSNDPKLMDKMFFELTKTLGESDEEKEVKEEELKEEEEEEEFGVAFVDEVDETIGKKKETINNTLQNEPNSENVQLEEENCVTVEEGINKTEPVIEPAIEQAIEPYLKKKRGKKK
jgi:hypothetical protein